MKCNLQNVKNNVDDIGRRGWLESGNKKGKRPRKI